MRFTSRDHYISRRSPVFSLGGMVATSQPTATEAGLAILRAGGSAADAAVAAAAALQVSQPCSTGLGGDAFALYYEASTGRVHALNGSGRSPKGLTLEQAKEIAADSSADARVAGPGIDSQPRIPKFHPDTVSVPGAPMAWQDTLSRFCRLDRGSVMEPAIRLAREGFPVAPLTAGWWARGAEKQLSLWRHGAELMIDGRGPNPGERFRNPNLAKSLEAFAASGETPFYEGHIAEAIVAELQHEGGHMTMEDLAAHRSEWTEAIYVDYHGVRLWECPPNGQGLAALFALQLLRDMDDSLVAASMAKGAQGTETGRTADSLMRYHLEIEAMRRGFAAARRLVADPDVVAWADPVRVQELLDGPAADLWHTELDPTRRADSPGPGMQLPGGDTVYLSAVDAEGNACSFINSNFMGFGTGIVPKGCGFTLQNRGHGFVLDESSVNCYGPGTRPYQTIIPAMATRIDGSLFASFGVMGGMMQPQGHLQVFRSLVDDELDPQAALDRARFQLDSGDPDGDVLVEDSLDEGVVASLGTLGHSLRTVSGSARSHFGLGQVIMPYGEGLVGGSDSRGDGYVAG